MDMFSKFKEQADILMQQSVEEKAHEGFEGVPRQLLDLREKLKHLGRLDKYE